MSLLADLTQYQDPVYHTISNVANPDKPSGNNLLYLAHYVMIADASNEDIDGKYVMTQIEQAEVERGLYNRKPGASDRESHDDYVGIAYISPTYAKDILKYGKDHNWNYDNIDKTSGLIDIIKQRGYFWHWRFPGLVAHYEICTRGYGPSIFGWLAWSIAIIFDAIRNDGTSSMLLNAIKLRVVRNSKIDNIFTRAAFSVYNWRLKRSYAGDYTNLYASYFGVYHPFTRFAKCLNK